MSLEEAATILHEAGLPARGTLALALFDRQEGTFPLPRSLGGRAIAWAEEDVSAWIAERPLQDILLDQASA